MKFSEEVVDSRYRLYKPLFKPPVLILQVKVRWKDGPIDHNGLPSYLAGEGWRDARPEDFRNFV